MKYLDLTQIITPRVPLTYGTKTVNNVESILQQKVNARLRRPDQKQFFPDSFKFIIYQSTTQATHYELLTLTK